MIFRDLEKVRVIIKEATDLDVAYAYDDLVFPEHAAGIWFNRQPNCGEQSSAKVFLPSNKKGKKLRLSSMNIRILS